MINEMFDSQEIRGMIQEAIDEAAALVRQISDASNNPLAQVWAMQRQIEIRLNNNVQLVINNDGNFTANTQHVGFVPQNTKIVVNVEGYLILPFVGRVKVTGRLESVQHHSTNEQQLVWVENDLWLNYQVNGETREIWVDTAGRVDIDVEYQDCGCGNGPDCGLSFLFSPEVNVRVNTRADANMEYFQPDQVTLTYHG